jgi:hypothetical protein
MAHTLVSPCLGHEPKAKVVTWITLGTEGTSGNHVRLREFGPICHRKTSFFKECGDIVLGNIGFFGNLCPFALNNHISLGNLGINALRSHVFQFICPMKHMF